MAHKQPSKDSALCIYCLPEGWEVIPGTVPVWAYHSQKRHVASLEAIATMCTWGEHKEPAK